MNAFQHKGSGKAGGGIQHVETLQMMGSNEEEEEEEEEKERYAGMLVMNAIAGWRTLKTNKTATDWW